MACTWFILNVLLLGLIFHPLYSAAYEVIYAVNCGGGKHKDRWGVRYRADDNKVGIASGYGMNLQISRIHPDDSPLYQTERYDTSSFTYDILIPEDGEYVLITKFAEVYFQLPNQKVFDVVLNGQHMVVQNLDIFAKVGRAAAYDEVIPFSIEEGQLHVDGESGDFDGVLSVEFTKGYADNPKVNAILVIKGPVDSSEIPAVPPPVQPEPQDLHKTNEPEAEWVDNSEQQSFKRTSGPRTQDPYASDDSWFMPITMAVAVFLPVLFCLCRVR